MTFDQRAQRWAEKRADEWETQQTKEWRAANDADFEKWVEKERASWLPRNRKGVWTNHDERQFDAYIEKARDRDNEQSEKKLNEWLAEHRPDYEAEMLEKFYNKYAP